MKLFFLLLAVGTALADSSDDAVFKKRQRQVLDLLIGSGHTKHLDNKYADWDISANLKDFVDEEYPKAFLAAYKKGLTTKNSILSYGSRYFGEEAIKIFDLFFFAKDFDTFYKAASWARFHIDANMFLFSFAHAIFHRPDTQGIEIPAPYEVLPNFFVPQDKLHQIYNYKMSGVEKGVVNFNSTGWEYDYHGGEFGGPLNPDNHGYADFTTSYFREDVALNTYWTNWVIQHPTWMTTEKYGPLPQLERRGEKFYYAIQQLFARYTLERLTKNLPYATILSWDKPIKVGYNPRLTYLNRKSMYARPDNMVPKESNSKIVLIVETLERRIYDAIDGGMIWDHGNRSIVELTEDSGTEILGRLIYGTNDRPSKSFYKPLYFAGLNTLSYMVSTAADRSYVGNAISTILTALRDPAFYNYLARLVFHFQYFKEKLGPYKHKDLFYPGVKVENVEVDRFATYNERFQFDVTNAVPLKNMDDYKDHQYEARTYRLNHKPYRINVTVNSEQKGDAVVRVFLGPKKHFEGHILNLAQARLSYFEIDRFQVMLNPGVQVLERSSFQSPLFSQDMPGFSAIYRNDYIKPNRIGFPNNLQLPMGSEGGHYFKLAVIVSPLDAKHASYRGYDAARTYDGRAMGFPFDRPFHGENDFDDVPNIFIKDETVYHDAWNA